MFSLSGEVVTPRRMGLLASWAKGVGAEGYELEPTAEDRIMVERLAALLVFHVVLGEAKQ